MKVSEFKKCAKRSRDPRLSSLGVSRSLVYRKPVNHLLYGVTHEGLTHEDGSCYFNAFILPLYIPQEQLMFNYGRRLSVQDNLEDDFDSRCANLEQVIVRELLPFWDKVPDLASLVPILKNSSMGRPLSKGLDYQILGPTQILLGDYQGGEESLNWTVNYYKKYIETASWIPEIIEQCETLLEKLSRGPEEAIAQLGEWTRYTRDNLKILED